MSRNLNSSPEAAVTNPKSQSDKFKQAARELEADEDEKRWEERLRKIVKQKPQGLEPD